jgi:exopolysaccharide production protein ExoQ
MSSQTLSIPRARPLVIPAFVGFYFAARLCITFLLFKSDPKVGAYVNFALHFTLFIGVLLYSFGPALNSFREMLAARPLRWVIAFLAIGLCSLAWSVTVSMPIAFAYWSELAAEVMMILLLLRVDEICAASTAVMKGYAAGAVLIAVVEWLSPTMYDLRPGDDDFFSPNAIGFTCAFGIFLIQIAARSSLLWRFVAFFLGLSLLRSLSKTTIIAFVATQGVMLLVDPSRSWRAKFALTLPAIVVLWAFWGLFENYYEVYTHLGNQSETLSGRIGIWAFVLTRSLEQPWLGHGFHSFRNVIPPFGSFEAWHAHNEILQQFYAYGVAGVLLVGMLYASLFRLIRKTSSQALKACLTALLLFILIRGLADTENFDLSLPLWFIALVSVMLAHAPVRISACTDRITSDRRRSIFGSSTEECTQ